MLEGHIMLRLFSRSPESFLSKAALCWSTSSLYWCIGFFLHMTTAPHYAFPLLSYIKGNYHSLLSWPVLPKTPVPIHCKTPITWTIPPHLCDPMATVALHTNLWYLLFFFSCPMCIIVQALQQDMLLCWFPRKSVRASPIVLSCKGFLICMHILVMDTFQSCFWSQDLSCPHCRLPSSSTTFSLDCRSSSLSHVSPSIKLFSSARSACWQRCFFPTWSGGSPLFLPVLPP